MKRALSSTQSFVEVCNFTNHQCSIIVLHPIQKPATASPFCSKNHIGRLFAAEKKRYIGAAHRFSIPLRYCWQDRTSYMYVSQLSWFLLLTPAKRTDIWLHWHRWRAPSEHGLQHTCSGVVLIIFIKHASTNLLPWPHRRPWMRFLWMHHSVSRSRSTQRPDSPGSMAG